MADDKRPEVREDEEQDVKAQESMQLLVTAGYFRARIKGLSNFDKIVGGLVWCLETCNFDVDVDLWYNDELTIGGKIALTEKIVTVLNAQKCPHKIEPHQIQGSDFIHIFPVVQWLVKKAIETRQATGDTVRQYSLSQYARYFGAPSEKDETDGTLSSVKCKHRQGMDNWTNSEKANDVINADVVADDILSNNDKLSKAVDQYQKLQQEKRVEGGHRGGQAETTTVNDLSELVSQLRQSKAQLKERLDQESRDASRFDEKFKSVKTQVKSLRSQLKSLKEKAQRIELEDGERERLRQLQALMSKNESLKKKEAEFKAKCKSERAKLTARNQELKDRLPTKNAEEGEDEEDLDLSALESQLSELKTELATKSTRLSGLERQLDQVPSSYELQQYQRRFFELDSQVSAEFSATQQFVTLFNTLIDQKSFTEKAISLLDSVLDTLPDSRYSSSSTKAQFVDKMSKLLQNVEVARANYERNFRDNETKKIEASDELNKLLDEQRHYALLVKEMREEMRKNEQLAQKLAAKTQQH